MMHLLFRKMAFAFCFACFFIFSSQAQSNMVSHIGDSATRFYSILKLSDGTFLLGGETKTLSWLPLGINVSTLVMPDTTNSRSSRIAVIVHLNAEMNSILRVVRFPANTVKDVFKIKTNSLPGEPTKDIFISGNRENEFASSPSSKGYYLAKLDRNFLNGNSPTSLSFIYDVRCPDRATNSALIPYFAEKTNAYKIIQPWDVQSDGKIVFASGHDYSASWAIINRLRVSGKQLDTVANWPTHWVRVKSSNAQVNGRQTEVRNINLNHPPDSIWLTVNSLNFADSVAIDSADYSGIVLKVNRGGSNLRSFTLADYQTVVNDENQNPNRQGRFPEDFMYPTPCLPGSGNCSNTGSGYLGYSTNYGNNQNATHRVGGICIDKRNNNLFVGYSTICRHPASRFGSNDLEPMVASFHVNGKMNWWNRLHKEEPAGSPALQEVDHVEVDYTNNQLLVVGASTDSCRFNFWKGNEIAANPTAFGFQNQFTGENSEIRYAWLGKVDLPTGVLRNATYVGEYANNWGLTGAFLSNPKLDNWPDPNSGNLNLDPTRIKSVSIHANGDILIVGEGTRTISTLDAFQKMPKALQGLAPRNNFVRIYPSDLSSIKYSSAISGLYDPTVFGRTPSVNVNQAIFSGNQIAAVGFHSGIGGKMPVINPPAFGDSIYRRKLGVVALLSADCSGPESPLGITSSSTNGAFCSDVSYTFNAQASGIGNPKFTWSYPSGWLGNDTSSVGGATNLVLIPSIKADSGKLLLVQRNRCGVSYPIYMRLPKPLPSAISIKAINSGSFSYNLAANTAFWFINGDTAKNAQGVPLKGATLLLSQIANLPLSGNFALTAGFTNPCGQIVSNTIMVTQALQKVFKDQVILYPNPAQSAVQLTLPEGLKVNTLLLTDQVGKVLITISQLQMEEKINLQISHLPKGIYFLELSTNHGYILKRFIKE